MGASLTARNLIKRFGPTTAVDGVDLEVPPGRFVSLLGPSGCGKTTTLRMVAGLERVDAGRILIDGRDVTGIPAQRRGVGMVFQQYALFPNMTAFENVAFGLRARRKPKGELVNRVTELLELVHLTDAADRYPHQLSGGMQQRVALARALAIAPPLLLLDEPLSALDATIREALRIELRRLQRQLGLTVIYVTHDQAEAMALSDVIAVMEQGRVRQVGSPREIYDRPATRFMASFVGVSNRRETTVERTNGNTMIRWGSARLLVAGHGDLNGGQAVTATWRPEAATIADAAGASSPEHVLRGRVEFVTFLGAITRLHVVIDGDPEPVIVDLASSLARDLNPDRDVTITVPAHAIRLYT